MPAILVGGDREHARLLRESAIIIGANRVEQKSSVFDKLLENHGSIRFTPKSEEDGRMSHRSRSIAVVLSAVIFSVVLFNLAFAEMSCVELKYGNPNYRENMDELAKRAGLPDNYWSRYHESVVSALCSGDTKDIDNLIDNGYVKAKEVEGIAKVLGKTYKTKQRSQTGQSYGYSKEKFMEMGACSACADNIAQYYTKKPDSTCGKLAKQALEGNPEAMKKIAGYPDYCVWKY